MEGSRLKLAGEPMRQGRRRPMALWRHTVLPAFATFVALISLSACANGGGLRVEGAEAPPSSPMPSTVLGTNGVRPEPKGTPEVAVDLAQVRLKLLADKHLPTYSRSVLENCTVI